VKARPGLNARGDGEKKLWSTAIEERKDRIEVAPREKKDPSTGEKKKGEKAWRGHVNKEGKGLPKKKRGNNEKKRESIVIQKKKTSKERGA